MIYYETSAMDWFSETMLQNKYFVEGNILVDAKLG